ncbi:hypothetical protein PHJA_001527500 [Phtheirospermum japonicum]|uniref:DUF3741 domain-containing protein n=1 Tax=Phtheirospermum japonicum TaxID=374723 RepID=A0A830C6S1_9LAMI|nr:hypothetical protein PHJA_001527500 [Phtheirospermum japonicum]
MAAHSADHVTSTTKCCYSAVLRRLLCSGSLPTHPSDQFDDPKAENCLKPEENGKQGVNSINPGVVARLMGLDSFPNTPSAQKDNTLGSFFRSKSVNSIDFISHFDPVKQHRRVRTSVSFREGINYHHDCVSNLERVDEIGDDEEKRKKNEKRGGNGNSERLGEKKVINKKSGKRVEMEEQRILSQKMDLHGKKREGLKEKRAVMKKRQSNILGHKKVHPEWIVPGVSPRHVLPSKIAKSRSPYSNSAYSHNVDVRAITKRKKEKKLKKKESNCYYKRMVEIICGLTEESVGEKWMYGSVLKFDDFEEMCKQLGQEILEVLLKQFVDEIIIMGQGINY